MPENLQSDSAIGQIDRPDILESEPEAIYLSDADERANVLTHGIGFLLCLYACWAFWHWSADEETGMRICCVAFTISMTAVYFFSTLSHLVVEPVARNRLRAWDQGTIYFLIVGNYSPFVWASTTGSIRLAFLAAIWGAALFGFYSKVFAKHRVNAVSTITYLALGWLPAMPLISSAPMICLIWMLIGGVSYSIGVLFLKNSTRATYMHAAWHIFVMIGTSSHAYAVYRLLLLTEQGQLNG